MNLVVLLILNDDASKTLSAAGVHVGLLGAPLSLRDAYGRPVDAS